MLRVAAIAFAPVMLLIGSASLNATDIPVDVGEELALWPGAAPGSEKLTIEEALTERSADPSRPDRIYTRITKPTLRLAVPQQPNGAAVIVAPGGAYQRVVADKEGADICAWLNGLGVTAFILKYRLPDEGHENGRDVPLMDAQRAVRVVRREAARLGLDPQRIGFIGFSAGGHLAGTLATHFSRQVYAPRDAADALSARPDFAILGYPAVGRDPRPGEPGEPSPRLQLMREYRVDSAVTKDTPPMFLFHADDDRSVPASGSARVYLALREAGVPAELHIFKRGGHGFGIRDAAGPIALWPKLCGEWLEAMGILKK